MSHRLPNELWLEVFQDLPQNLFKKSYLKCVSLTCRTFHVVSRPLLFANFDWHPYVLFNDGVRLPLPEKFELAIQRLEFWSSDAIAPLVRSCDIMPWRGYDTSASDAPYFLRDEFFRRLPCFTGLQRVFAYRLHFTQQGLISLCRSPVLAFLYIDTCYFAQGEEIFPNGLELKVSTFVFRHRNENLPRGFVNHWMQLLHRNHLRELDVDPCRGFFGNNVVEETINGAGTGRFVMRKIDELPSFPHVYKLTLSMLLHSAMSYSDLAVLSQFPGVWAFSIDGRTLREDGPLPRLQAPQTLPVLAEYSGPYHALQLLLPRATLTHLTISTCHIDDLIKELKGIHTLDNITSLDATFYDSMDHVTLNALCGFFPRLAELHIRISFHLLEEDNFEYDISPKPVRFFKMVAESAALPPTLERLAMSWVYRSDYFLEVEMVNPLPRFAYLRDTLVARCPALTSLWLDGYNFLFRWRKFATKVIENSARNIYDTEALRNDSDSADFWKSNEWEVY
ncbi:hypothetical protein C8R44DRAFT_976583, partial [Mycena epipterygia]